MKKLILPLLLVCGLSTMAFGSDIGQALNDLNNTIDKLTSPFRNDSTVVNLQFKKLSTDDSRALEMVVTGLFKKIGPHNTFEARLDNLEYSFDQGLAPFVNIKGFLGFDVTKVFPQEQLNQIVPELEEIIKSVGKNITGAYGDAADVKIVTLEKTMDEAGNFTAISGHVSATVDFNQLPQSMTKEDVAFFSGSLKIKASLKDGLDFEISVLMNPEFKAFERDQVGLKETIEKLLAQDPDALYQIESALQMLNHASGRIVNGQGF